MRNYDLYIVPTPIGNLGDITLRAVEILKSVDLIACEDMRNTQKLLNHFEIKTKCISYHKFNEKERLNLFLEKLSNGNKIALVSDAGTPLFCDPGAILVEELKNKGYSVTALPGANAAVTLLSQLPRYGEDFIFIGFLPKSEKQIVDILTKYRSENIVFYDSPNRLLSTLEVVQKTEPGKLVSVGRELTKVFEEVITDTVENVISHFKKNVLKGEIVGVIHKTQTSASVEEYSEKIAQLRKKNFSDKDISIIISTLFNVNKNEVYSYITKCK